MDVVDETVVNHRSDPSPSAPETAQPESTIMSNNESPDTPTGAMHSLPPSPVSVDVPEASLSAGRSTDQYRPLVLAILERAKRYPLLAQHRGIEGTVEVAFLINPDGRLSDPELIASSNHRVLDDATLTMLHRVGNLPPPPDREPLRFPARIQYQIDQ